MPVFIYPQPGGNPIASFIISVAALAIFVGLVIFFLPLIAGIVVALLLLGLAFWAWNWFKGKFGTEDEETRIFREPWSKRKPLRASSTAVRTRDGCTKKCVPVV